MTFFVNRPIIDAESKDMMDCFFLLLSLYVTFNEVIYETEFGKVL